MSGNNPTNPFAKYLVKSFTRKIDAGSDDNLNILAKPRFFSTPANKNALYSAMPVKMEPVRYNYNYSDYGLVVNNHKVVLIIHDRSITNVYLNPILRGVGGFHHLFTRICIAP